MALPNNSNYTEETLSILDKNIKIVRHPKNYFSLWSHHEKTVIVDN